MLLRMSCDVAAPIKRTPAASLRFALFAAAPRVGAPVPWTRFWVTTVSVIVAEEPAVIRTPSWP